jgi:hypothetical protein
MSDDFIRPGVAVEAVIELNAGTAQAIGLSPGDRVQHRMFSTATREGLAYRRANGRRVRRPPQSPTAQIKSTTRRVTPSEECITSLRNSR